MRGFGGLLGWCLRRRERQGGGMVISGKMWGRREKNSGMGSKVGCGG